MHLSSTRTWKSGFSRHAAFAAELDRKSDLTNSNVRIRVYSIHRFQVDVSGTGLSDASIVKPASGDAAQQGKLNCEW
jgi:hypothetical protein